LTRGEDSPIHRKFETRKSEDRNPVAQTARSAVSQAAGPRGIPPTGQSAIQQTSGLRYVESEVELFFFGFPYSILIRIELEGRIVAVSLSIVKDASLSVDLRLSTSDLRIPTINEFDLRKLEL
jgi:hypothetical protein